MDRTLSIWEVFVFGFAHRALCVTEGKLWHFLRKHFIFFTTVFQCELYVLGRFSEVGVKFRKRKVTERWWTRSQLHVSERSKIRKMTTTTFQSLVSINMRIHFLGASKWMAKILVIPLLVLFLILKKKKYILSYQFCTTFRLVIAICSFCCCCWQTKHNCRHAVMSRGERPKQLINRLITGEEIAAETLMMKGAVWNHGWREEISPRCDHDPR